MPVPAWQAPTAGFSALAGHVNQFLGTHAVTYLYTGTQQAASSGVSGTTATSNTDWYAQKFTAGSSQTAAGYVQIHVTSLTGSPPPWEISLQADSAGAPSGTPLVTAALPKELAGGTGWVTIPLPSAVTASSPYWIVAPLTGDVSDYFGWSLSTAVSGASYSAAGTSWTAAAYGLTYQVYDQSAVPPLAATWEDSGARWTSLGYNGSGQLAALGEMTAGQAANGYTASSRTLSYSAGGILTGVA